MALKRSPLLEEHQRLSAKLVEFAGWEMPISYPTGTLSEHDECRNACVMFDVSHLGSVLLEGEGAFEELQYAFTNDLSKISPGRAQYSHLLNQKGYVVDDVIIWWLGEGKFEVMPNASNPLRVEEALVRRGKKLNITNITEDRAVIAVQGPTSRKILSSLSVQAASVKRFHVEEMDINGMAATVAGTGYTGEDGVEISIPKNTAPILWTALLEAGCTPAGLGARDTLRLEAGLPLHGQELGEGISPLQANMQWVVSMSKGTFFGKEALQEELDNGPTRSLRGFISALPIAPPYLPPPIPAPDHPPPSAEPILCRRTSSTSAPAASPARSRCVTTFGSTTSGSSGTASSRCAAMLVALSMIFSDA